MFLLNKGLFAAILRLLVLDALETLAPGSHASRMQGHR